jgi:hypothetical protein
MNLLLLLPTLIIAAIWYASERMRAPAPVPVRPKRR